MFKIKIELYVKVKKVYANGLSRFILYKNEL